MIYTKRRELRRRMMRRAFIASQCKNAADFIRGLVPDMIAAIALIAAMLGISLFAAIIR